MKMANEGEVQIEEVNLSQVRRGIIQHRCTDVRKGRNQQLVISGERIRAAQCSSSSNNFCMSYR